MSDSVKMSAKETNSSSYQGFPDFALNKNSANKTANDSEVVADLMDTECAAEGPENTRQEKILHSDFYRDFGDLFDSVEP
uniref:AGC-kinase C-terminal domain-containing protein n=1 Tax=Syphacia muris TaxID=451379 RepID=A0A0N5AID9_9BILA